MCLFVFVCISTYMCVLGCAFVYACGASVKKLGILSPTAFPALFSSLLSGGPLVYLLLHYYQSAPQEQN